MSKEHVVVIHPNGDVRTLYTDLIDLRELGALDVQRASSVEWSDKHGGWTVQFPNGKFLAYCNESEEFFESNYGDWWTYREDALAAEVAYLNARL